LKKSPFFWQDPVWWRNGSGETEMNRFGFTPETMKISLCDESLPQDPSEARGAGFFSILLTDPPRGHPIGAAVFLIL
jgi:hypothetical protein